jgi:hypothetical protein
MIYKMCLGDLLRFGVIYVIFLAGFTQGRIRSVQNMVIARILSNIVLRWILYCSSLGPYSSLFVK